MSRVVHCKKEPYDVYIGRPSKWGNPFSDRPGAEDEFRVSSREEAIVAFEMWIRQQPSLMVEVKQLKGKILGCWCKPRPCHGDVLVKLANE